MEIDVNIKVGDYVRFNGDKATWKLIAISEYVDRGERRRSYKFSFETEDAYRTDFHDEHE